MSTTGELFYASGEVAVQPPQSSAPSQTLRLRTVQSYQRRRGKPETDGFLSHQHEHAMGDAAVSDDGQHVHDIERRAKEASESLSKLERRLIELGRDATRAQFEGEDTQTRHSAALIQVQ